MSNVFVLKDTDGRLYHPSLQASVLAKYSRSPQSALDLISSLSAEESEKFHEKWVINYGHSSVAELSVIPICFEGVSMIASKFIESFQRAGYSEKSTRYQRFSRESFINPTGDQSVSNFISRYYDQYDRLHDLALSNACLKSGLTDTSENRALPKIKARAFDSLRYLLPAGTGTNLAAVMNLRDVRYLVSLARSSTNPEIRAIGEAVFKAASEITPALIQKADPDFFDIRTPNFAYPITGNGWGVELLDYDKNALERFTENVRQLYGMDFERFASHMKNRKQSQVPSVFKRHTVEFMLTMDYGAYRDLQRHRRCEQWSEYLTPFIGYEIPDDFIGTGMEDNYKRTMESVQSLEADVIHNPEVYQYVIPMGYLHRSIFRMDLRELYYISELRTKPQGHISYRRIAYGMYEKTNEKMPQLMQWCLAEKPEKIGDHL